MIRKHPWLVGIAFGGLIAIANAQTIGGFGGGGGGSTSFPLLAPNGSQAAPSYSFTNNTGSGLYLDPVNDVSIAVSNVLNFSFGSSGSATIQATRTTTRGSISLAAGSGSDVLVNGNAFTMTMPGTFTFTSPVSGTLQLGQPDAASPVAQTIAAQSIAAGSSNASAALLTVTNNAARGTGTGIGGAIVFQTAPPGLSSTNQNPLVPSFIIDGASHLRIGSMTAPSISSCGGGSPTVVGTDQGGIITFGTTATTCTLTWTNAYNSTPICTVDWQNNLATMNFTPSNTNLLLAQTSTSGNKAHYICFANKGG